MPTKRILVKTTKRILGLRFGFKLSIRAIARHVGIGRSSVSRILECATVANLTWPLPEGMTDLKLETIFYPGSAWSGSIPSPVPDWLRSNRNSPDIDPGAALDGVY